MIRKSIMLLSIASLIALIVWGFAPSAAPTACASGAASVQANCALQLTVDRPVFNGTAQDPRSASVHWNITNLPPCYQIAETTVTFTITRNNQPNVVLTKTVTSGTSTAVNLATPLGSNLAPGFRPNAIVAEVRVKATAINPDKTKTESNTLAIP